MKDEPKHLYQKLAANIRKMLPDLGEQLLPSERDLANRFSANRLTVRRALDELENAGEVIRHVGRGYSAAPAFLSVSTSSKTATKVIGYPLWIENYDDLDFVHSHARLMSMRRIRHCLKQFGCELDVQFVGTRSNPKMELISKLLKTWSGYITEPVFRPQEDPFASLRDFRVLVGYEEGTVHNCVRIDFQQVARLCLRHIVERGAQKILYVGDSEEECTQGLLRTIGVEQEILNYRDIEIIRCVSDNGIYQGYGSVRKQILDGVKFDAVLCGSSYMAVGVVRALIDSGIMIPGQVQVIGSGHLSLYHYFYPRITVVCAEEGDLSDAAARMAWRLVRDGGKPQESLVIPVSVMQGETTRQFGEGPDQEEDFKLKVTGKSAQVRV